MKKAQIEVMGLVLIVILIAIAMLFTLQFVILKQPTGIKKIYTHSKLSSSVLNALLKTNTKCRGIDFTGLLQDCAASGIITCPGFLNSCDYAEQEIDKTFNNTLRRWNIAFEFTVKKSADVDVIDPISNLDCTGERQSKIYPIPTDVGIMTIKLDICS